MLNFQKQLTFLFIIYLLMITKVFALSSFASAEHIAIGDEIKLIFSTTDPGQIGKPLSLPNGLSMTYGDIIAFGDLYGTVGQPISKGATNTERQALFLSAFNAFARDPNVILEATSLLKVMHDEKTTLQDGLKHGETSEEIYARLGDSIDRQYNCITGGGCEPVTWYLKPGRFLSLAENNIDHFGENAVIAYQTGHALAEEIAITGHQRQDSKLLELAYEMNAFASHFLSDLFAAGHMRTPRVELAEQVTPSLIAAALSVYMHDEENEKGLHFHDNVGHHWFAYGDHSYFNPQNEVHRYFINFVLQGSARQIFECFHRGYIDPNDEKMLLDFMPHADETKNAANVDISPLFYWDDKAKLLMRRAHIGSLYDRQWTSSWRVLSTLVELKRVKGISNHLQAMLARSGERDEALAQRLITNKEILAYLKEEKGNKHKTI